MKKLNCLIILVLLPFFVLFGQNNQPNIDTAEKKAVIDAVCENLQREYIFPDVTEKIVGLLRDKLRSGKYDAIAKPRDFANEITKDVRSVNNDAHLNIGYSPEWIKNKKNTELMWIGKNKKIISLEKRKHTEATKFMTEFLKKNLGTGIPKGLQSDFKRGFKVSIGNKNLSKSIKEAASELILIDGTFLRFN